MCIKDLYIYKYVNSSGSATYLLCNIHALLSADRQSLQCVRSASAEWLGGRSGGGELERLGFGWLGMIGWVLGFW